jgi:DNA-binding MltR family transcriptional regulator
MTDAKSEIVFHCDDWVAFFEELKKEADRAASVLLCSWLDDLLRRKLQQHFSKGNSEARGKLFSGDGALGRFSSRIDAAFCLGLFETDVYHDLHVLRKVRNFFAHRLQGLTYETPEIRKLIDSLQVPHRDFYDWGKLRCAAIRDGGGVVILSGESHDEKFGEELRFPAGITFRLGASRLIAYLASSFEVSILLPDPEGEKPTNEELWDMGE